MQDERTTLTQFIIEAPRRIAGARGDFTRLLNNIATVGAMSANAVARYSHPIVTRVRMIPRTRREQTMPSAEEAICQ
jgi:hypothetical protein